MNKKTFFLSALALAGGFLVFVFFFVVQKQGSTGEIKTVGDLDGVVNEVKAADVDSLDTSINQIFSGF